MLRLPLYVFVGLEVALVALLMLPIKPVRNLAISTVGLFKSPGGGTLVSTVYAAALGILCANSLFELRSKTNAVRAGAQQSVSQSFIDERDIYNLRETVFLTGSGLLLVGVLRVLHATMRSLERAELSNDALQRQAKNVQTEYLRLQKEAQAQESKEVDVKPGEKSVVEQLRTENEKLQSKMEEAWKSGLEFRRLLEENEDLKAQLRAIDRSTSFSGDKKRS
eukprot:jgi/Chlat1/1082/Chrsp110S01572